MANENHPIKINAADVSPRTPATIYPEPFKAMFSGREKRVLGDKFGLTTFGVNLTTLHPGASSALRHWHSAQDEFIFVVSGELCLINDQGKTILKAGECAGFKSGVNNGHHLINLSNEPGIYLEVGDRTAGDIANYPDDDIQAVAENGKWVFTHKDGRPYPP